MARVLRQVGWMFLLIAFRTVQAEDAGFKKSQYYRGITLHHLATYVTEADLDGDGLKEVLVCYREPGDAVGQQGGVLILSRKASDYVVAYHALFENQYPKKVSVSGGELTFELVQTNMQGDQTISKTLAKGKDFFFLGEKGNSFTDVKISASSTLKKDVISPKNLFDRNLETAWAEGAEGTGVDETVTFEFPKPVNLGLIGVLHGNYQGRRQWMENNRLHRAEVTVETSSDRYDTTSDVDFGADLGLGLYGDRVELTFSNKPVMRYFKLDRKNVVSVELKITSVLLGEKNDDAYIAEVDFAELIPGGKIFGEKEKAPKEQKKEEEPVKESKEEDEGWEEDEGF